MSSQVKSLQIKPRSSQLIEQELELVTDGRLGVLYRALPVGGVNLVEVPLQHLRYRGLALVAVPQQRLGRTHRLRGVQWFRGGNQMAG